MSLFTPLCPNLRMPGVIINKNIYLKLRISGVVIHETMYQKLRMSDVFILFHTIICLKERRFFVVFTSLLQKLRMSVSLLAGKWSSETANIHVHENASIFKK